MFTRYYQGANLDYRAETKIKITKKRELIIATLKKYEGSLDRVATHATVLSRAPLGGPFYVNATSCVEQFFSRIVLYGECPPTEKNIKEQHEKALQNIDEITAMVEEHYVRIDKLLKKEASARRAALKKHQQE